MAKISSFHDGAFDGLCLSDHDVHLFVKEYDGERSTVVLRDVRNMKLNEVMQGNTIFELRFISPEELEVCDMRELLLGGDDPEDLPKFFRMAQEKKLSVLEVHSSYGAQGKVLFREAEVLPDYVFPRLGPKPPG